MDMAHERNYYEQMAPHYDFHLSFNKTLEEVMPHLPARTILDFGAGRIPSHSTPFSKTGRNVVAFDPSVDIALYRQLQPRWPQSAPQWTNVLPTGEFPLIGCHFSMHHLSTSPEETIADFRRFSPRIVTVADYDFTSATREEFAQAFRTETEMQEIDELFDGDIDACYEFHRRLGKQDYLNALQQNGYDVIREVNGLDTAKYKFYVFAEKLARLEV